MSLTACQTAITIEALKAYVKQIEAELDTTSDISYAWSLLFQAREEAWRAIEALQGV